MRSIKSFVVLILLISACRSLASTESDRAAIKATDDAIHAGFAEGDVAAILKYHHPDVNKALSYKKTLIGREAVAADLHGTLDAFHLEFVQSNVESFLINGDTAIEQSLFVIKGTPFKGGESFEFKSRAIVVYVRYKDSPTGWASIREVIQPATERANL